MFIVLSARHQQIQSRQKVGDQIGEIGENLQYSPTLWSSFFWGGFGILYWLSLVVNNYIFGNNRKCKVHKRLEIKLEKLEKFSNILQCYEVFIFFGFWNFVFVVNNYIFGNNRKYKVHKRLEIKLEKLEKISNILQCYEVFFFRCNLQLFF